MFINLRVRDVTDNMSNWDSCQSHTKCKVVSIIGIILASFVLIWILIASINFCFCGFACAESFCCCFTWCSRYPRHGQQGLQVPMYMNSEKPHGNANLYPRNQMNYANNNGMKSSNEKVLNEERFKLIA